MKKLIITTILFASLVVVFNSCSQSKFEELYTDPSKTSSATVENFFGGVLQSANLYTMPWYWRYFVVENSTVGHYTQVFGWVNGNDQYLPSSAAMEDRWTNFYGVMRNYRELEYLYNNSTEDDKNDKRIFLLAAKIFVYDQTEQIVTLWGDIPWSEAGMLKVNGGDLGVSLPKYDAASEIYTAMLDDLKSIADELATIQIKPAYASSFTNKDYINDGSVDAWRRYANSLRLRLLARISDVDNARTKSEVAAILGNPAQYPIVEDNSQNILIDCKGPDLWACQNQHGDGIREGLETWGTQNYAPAAMVNLMKATADPRLRVYFEPSLGEYLGVDPLDNAADQETFIAANKVARYDSATFSRNNTLPGTLITAAEVSFIKAEAFNKGWASGDAKTAYETGIKQSIEYYYYLNGMRNFFNFSKEPEAELTETEVNDYLASSQVNWDSNSDKINLIGTQKWIHFGILQMNQNWAEVRRLDKPVLTFMQDVSSAQKQPPYRFVYPSSEKQLNGANYATVQSKDNYSTKVWWDVN